MPGRTCRRATADDASHLADLHAAVAVRLTEQFGRGPWSSNTTANGVLFALRRSQVYVVHEEEEIIATFRLSTRRPWAIDATCFVPCSKPLYLTAMAVLPSRQRTGVGRWCLQEADRIAREEQAGAIRLDTYDAQGGAGGFYLSNGYREIARCSYRNIPLIYFERRPERGPANHNIL